MEINVRRLILICISIVIGCIIIATAVFAGAKIHSYNVGVKYLQDGDYKKAVKELGKVSYIGFFKVKYEKEVKKAANELYEKFAAGEMTYEDAMESIKVLGWLVETKDITQRLKVLDVSIKNYNDGEQYKVEGEYVYAIECFSLIQEGDKLYEMAQSRISECAELLETKTVTMLEQMKKDKKFTEALLLIETTKPYVSPGRFDKYSEIFERQRLDYEEKQDNSEKLQEYKGKWTSPEKEAKTKGIEITIHSIDFDTAYFSASYKAKNRTVSLKYVTGAVVGNVITAEYKQGDEAGGNITLVLNDGSINFKVFENARDGKEYMLVSDGTCYKAD